MKKRLNGNRQKNKIKKLDKSEICRIIYAECRIGRFLIVKKVKIFLFGSEFWQGLDEFIKNTLVSQKTIKKEDINLYKITDDLELIVNEILAI